MSRPGSFRSMRFPRKSWPAVVAASLIAGFAAWQRSHPDIATPAGPDHFESRTCRVLRVVDGDTFVLAGSKERVRLIGANTPETVKPDWPVEPWGPEASQFTKKFLAGGEVRLEFDGDPRDKYGRLLAYVWVGNRMLNEELLRAGLARAEMQYRYSKEMKSRFRRAEAEARNSRRGIWSGS
jgi:micrococcal nuclease